MTIEIHRPEVAMIRTHIFRPLLKAEQHCVPAGRYAGLPDSAGESVVARIVILGVSFETGWRLQCYA